MKVGDEIEFYLFNVKRTGEVYQVNKDKTLGIVYEGFKYPDTQILKTIPKKIKDIPPWYIYK